MIDPTTWDKTSLRWLGSITAGGTPSRKSPEYWGGDIPWIGSGEVNQRVINNPTEYITKKGLSESSTKIFPKDTVMIALAGQGKTKGTAGILGIDSAANQSLAGIECRKSDLNPWFLLYRLEADYQQLRGIAGEARDGLNLENLKSWKIKVPDTSTQNKIVDWIDENVRVIDDLIDKQKELLKVLKEYNDSVIHQAVTKGLDFEGEICSPDISWIDSIRNDWDLIPLKHSSPKITVGIVQKPSQYYVDEAGVPALRSLNIQSGEIIEEDMIYISEKANERLEGSRLQAGDLVSVRSGDPGRTAVVPNHLSGVNCIDVIIIRKPNRYLPEYLSLLMNSEIAKRQFQLETDGAAQQHFNVEDAKNLVFPTPKIEEQQKILEKASHYTSIVEKKQNMIRRCISLLQEKRRALITKAVSGQIDLTDWENPGKKEVI